MIDLPNMMQIRAFVRVAESGSVSKASVALYRAQSVITRSIQDLEQRLGVVLFERHANGMRLTDHGHRIVPRAQRVLSELLTVPRLIGSARTQTVEPLYLLHTRRLELFVGLCKTHHMQTVAASFGISQPAVSAALKVIERGCGRTLFERSASGLLPTRACLDILPSIRRALNALRHIDADIAAMRGSLQGLVTVGALPLGRTRILPEAIVHLIEAHPGVRVATNESPFDLLAAELRAGDIDFIFGALRPSNYANDLQGEALLSEDMAILARRGHPLFDQPVSAQALNSARWVLPRPGAPARLLLDACFAQLGIPAPTPVVETGDLAIIRGLLLNSDMLAAVSAHQLDYELASHALQRLPIPLQHTERAIGLTYRSAALHSAAAETLMQHIRDVTQSVSVGREQM